MKEIRIDISNKPQNPGIDSSTKNLTTSSPSVIMRLNSVLPLAATENGFTGPLKTRGGTWNHGGKIGRIPRIRDGIRKKIEEFLESESSEVPDAIGSFKF